MSERCSDRSLAAGEPLAATASTAISWLLFEVPGSWPRDVAEQDALPDSARERISAWLAAEPGPRRVLFLRRPRQSVGAHVAFVVRAEEAATEVRRIELDGHADLGALDLETAGDRVDAQLVLVCGHGSRDACCALRGTAVFGALESMTGDEELWISSHQGGHRFAANVLVLPAGLQFGRVGVDEAPFLVERALAGRIELDRYRGRTCYEPEIQAAEHAVRSAAGIDRVGALRLAGVQGAAVRFKAADGTVHTAAVGETGGPPVPVSCGAEPEPQPRFVARVL